MTPSCCRSTHQTCSVHFINCVCRWRISCIKYVQVFVSMLWVVQAKGSVIPVLHLSPCHDDTTAVDDEWFASNCSCITPRQMWYPLDRKLLGPLTSSGCCKEASLALAWNGTPSSSIIKL